MYFSTRAVDRASRREAWLSAINNLCGAFVTEIGTDEIDGAIDVRSIGGMDCLRVWQPAPNLAIRTPREIRRGGPIQYILKLQLVGNSRIEQRDRVITLAPGEAVLLDSELPVTFRTESKCHFFALHVPKEQLDGRGVIWDNFLAKPCPAPTASLVHSLMLSSFEWSQSLGPAQAQSAADAILSLFSAGHLDQRDIVADSVKGFTTPNLMKSIHAYIITRLDDETLSPGAIAKAHHISERQLHRLFEPLGLSVCRYIRKARLDRCAMSLRDPAQSNRTITEIAFSHGFSDSAHFSRAFRDEFSATPREYRTRALGRSTAIIVEAPEMPETESMNA